MDSDYTGKETIFLTIKTKQRKYNIFSPEARKVAELTEEFIHLISEKFPPSFIKENILDENHLISVFFTILSEILSEFMFSFEKQFHINAHDLLSWFLQGLPEIIKGHERYIAEVK